MTDLQRRLSRGQASATLVVASATATKEQMNAASYICDVVGDNAEVQQALNDLPSTGGKIILTDGTFHFSAQVHRAINNVTFAGGGYNTHVTFNGFNPAIQSGAQTGWLIYDMLFDAGGSEPASSFPSSGPSVLTIAGGLLTLPNRNQYVIVTGEGGVDDILTDITVGADGDELVLEWDGATNIEVQSQHLAGGLTQITLDAEQDSVLLSTPDDSRGRTSQIMLKYSGTRGAWLGKGGIAGAIGTYIAGASGFSGVRLDGTESQTWSKGVKKQSTRDVRITAYTMQSVDAASVTIASDRIVFATVASHRSLILADTEGAAASDNLASVSLADSPQDGDTLYVSPTDDTHTVVIKHNNAGGVSGFKLFTGDGLDITLDNLAKFATLIYRTSLDSGNGGWMAK